MNCDSHPRVNELAAKWRTQQVSPDESAWLESHLGQCPPCGQAMADLGRQIRKIRAVGPRASSRLVRATQLRCRERSRQLENRNRKLRPLFIACVLACAWMTLTLPFLWEQLSSFGGSSHAEDLMVHLVFLVMWFMPAMLGAAVALWLRPQLSAEDSNHRVAHSDGLEMAQTEWRLRA